MSPGMLAILGNELFGLMVVVAVMVWRPELYKITLGVARQLRLVSWVVFCASVVVMAFVWPVVLFAGIKRQRKYGESQGPAVVGVQTVSDTQVRALVQQIEAGGSRKTRRRMAAMYEKKAAQFVNKQRQKNHQATVDEVLVHWDGSSKDFHALCAEIGLTRDKMVAICLAAGAVEGGSKNG